MNTRRGRRVFLVCLGWLGLSLSAAFAVTLPFHDDFENIPAGWYPNANGWQTWFSGVSAYVSGQVYHSGARSFRLQSYPWWSRCDYVYLDRVPDQLTYEFSVYPDPFLGRAVRVGLASGSANQAPWGNYFTIRSRDAWVGLVDFTGPPGWPALPVGSFAVGQWVTVRADLNFKNGTSDLWLNGLLAASGVPVQPKEFYYASSGYAALNRLAAGECNWAGGGVGVMYVDDVAAFERFEPVTVTANIDIDPDTINLRSRGRWITCYIELPVGFSPTEVDPGSLLLNDAVAAEPWPVASGDYDSDGVGDLMVKFSRSLVASLLPLGQQKIALTGQMADGTLLAGECTVRVTR